MSDERHRVMIFKGQRTLDDGCDTCGKSEVYCDSVRELGRRCCGACSH